MKRILLFAPVALLMIVLQTSCGMGDSGGTTNPQQGSFLMANVSPDAPTLNIFINNSLLRQDFAYGAYTGYYTAVAGSYTLSFTNSANTPVLSNSINIEANKAYSYIVIDSFSKIKSTFFQDSLIVPGADSVYVRFFNFGPNSPAYNFRDSARGQVLSKQRTFNDQATNVTYTRFTRIPAGTYRFQLQKQDSTIAASKDFNLMGGHIYSIFAKGFVDTTGIQGLGLGQIQNF